MVVWNVRIGPNSVTSLHSQFYDTTTLVVGSINGIVTILDTESGMILNQYVPRRSADHTKWDRGLGTTINMSPDGLMRVTVHEHVGDCVDSSLQEIPRKNRPPILCLRTGMTNLVTTHPDGRIQLWTFNLNSHS